MRKPFRILSLPANSLGSRICGWNLPNSMILKTRREEGGRGCEGENRPQRHRGFVLEFQKASCVSLCLCGERFSTTPPLVYATMTSGPDGDIMFHRDTRS